MRSWSGLAFLFALVLGLAPRAAAADAEAEPCPRPLAGDDEEARSLYQDAERLYASGRYTESLAAYRAALERSGRAELYFDMANAHERMGQPVEAADLLDRYLLCARPGDGDLIGERVRRLRTSAAQLARPSCPATELQGGASAPHVPSLEARVAIDQARAAEPPGARAWPWLAAGGGALAVSLGLAVAAQATEQPPCADPPQGRACETSPIDTGAALGRAAAVTAAVGLISLGTGAVILARKRRPARRRAMPWVGQGIIGVAIRGDL
ncbi:MAG TPA: tetratricopeptide repeat protein [Kofleriaceae bacterium]|nr:tetratricopeptide repeat protein [Kofleriaceae bacterium]